VQLRMLRSGEALPCCLPAHAEGVTDLIPGAARAASRIRSRALDRVEVALELRGCSEHFEGIGIATVDQSIPCLPRGKFLAHVCQGALTTLYVSRIPDTNAGSQTKTLSQDATFVSLPPEPAFPALPCVS
jgi:hypothetical protein